MEESKYPHIANVHTHVLPEETFLDIKKRLEGGPIQIHSTYVPEEKYNALREASEKALKELERIGVFLAIDHSVVKNLKNLLA